MEKGVSPFRPNFCRNADISLLLFAANDVLYVEPNKARKGNAKYSQSGQFNVSLASTIISALSVLASLGIALLVK